MHSWRGVWPTKKKEKKRRNHHWALWRRYPSLSEKLTANIHCSQGEFGQARHKYYWGFCFLSKPDEQLVKLSQPTALRFSGLANFSLFFSFLLRLCLSKTFESEMISPRKRIITSTQTDALMTDYLAMAASSLYVAAVPTEAALCSLSADAAKMAANVWIFTPSKITADNSSCVSSEGSLPWLLQRLDQPITQDRQPHGTFTFLAMH